MSNEKNKKAKEVSIYIIVAIVTAVVFSLLF